MVVVASDSARSWIHQRVCFPVGVLAGMRQSGQDLALIAIGGAEERPGWTGSGVWKVYGMYYWAT